MFVKSLSFREVLESHTYSLKEGELVIELFIYLFEVESILSKYKICQSQIAQSKLFISVEILAELKLLLELGRHALDFFSKVFREKQRCYNSPDISKYS